MRIRDITALLFLNALIISAYAEVVLESIIHMGGRRGSLSQG